MNDYWICDEGRYSYKAANDPNLLEAMYVRKNGELEPVPIDEAVERRSGAQGDLRGGRNCRGHALAILDRRGSLSAAIT